MNKIRSKRFGNSEPSIRICLVAPRHTESFWSLQGLADLFGAKTLMPNAALATLVALTPKGVNVEYILCDENVAPIDWNIDCDLAAITGATLHAKRIGQLCERFRKRGVSIALGGTFATINADQCKNLADHLFVGEAEHTWPLFLKELSKGKARDIYCQEEHIDLSFSPAPDWSMISARDYVNIPIQTSRGCPNRCDFCDVLQFMGQKVRTKPIDQVLVELKNAHAIGGESIFISDDNFIGNKKYTIDLLNAIIDWNSKLTRPLSFSTQISVQVADDDDLLKLFADARFSVLFLGVETVREQSLAEVQKSHNVKKDIRQRIRNVSRYGIVPFIGLIVGFDHDDPQVFEELYEFLDETDSPIAGVSLLNAPKNTPLYKRLQKEDRLVGEDFSGEWQLATNIIPINMASEDLLDNYWHLFQRIYDPVSFEKRLWNWLEQVEYFTEVYTQKKNGLHQLRNLRRMLTHFIFHEDPVVRSLFFGNLIRTMKLNAKLLKKAFTMWAQFRHFHDFVNRPLPYSAQSTKP